MRFKILLLISTLVINSSAIKKSYDGYKLYNVIPQSIEEVEILKDVQNSAVGEFWNEYFDVKQDVKIMVASEKQEAFLEVLSKAKIEVTEAIADLQRAINDQLNPSNVRSSDTLLSYSWDKYYTLEHIYNWLDELAAEYPDIVTTVVMGKSVEDRDIKGVILNFKPEREDVKIGMLEGTLHAREWISAATVTYIIKEFLTSTDPGIRALADNFEWHIFPVVNPDGYIYTFTTDRMWRKNRSKSNYRICAEGVDNDMSNGVDLNRNFNFVWMTVGASNDSCTNTYAGPSPSSEAETKSIVNYVLSLKQRGNFIYYISLHSFTQLIIVPYSHLSNGGDEGRPSNYADMYEIAIRSSDALAQRFGTLYRVGVSAKVLYPMSGTSFDWVRYEADVPISYLIELRDLGEFGFLLPADQIIPNGQELMDGLVEMDKTAINLGYYKSSAVGAISSMILIVIGILVAILNN